MMLKETVHIKNLPTEPIRQQTLDVSSRWMLPAGMFVLLLAFFLSFPSRDYTAVDGALRAVAVFGERSFSFHGNNHLLYPFWIWTWNRMMEAIGIHASNVFEFVRISQALNALFAAGAVIALFSSLRLFVESKIALLYSLGFGFSTAFLLHATNSAEPMPGLFFVLAGMRTLLAGLRHANGAILAAAGMLFALALASYQAMGTVAVLAGFTCCCWAYLKRENISRTFASMLWVLAGALAAICGVYGFAYAREGIAPARMPQQFLSLGGNPGVYSGFTISRVLNTPMGLLRNVFLGVPAGYSGIRALLHDPRRIVWIPAALAGLAVTAAIVWLAGVALRNATRLWPKSLAALGLAAIGSLCFPLLYWDPLYDKLWLLPLAAAAAALALASRPGLLTAGQRKIMTALLLVVFCAECAVNLSMVLRSHLQPTPHLSEAEDVNHVIAPNDWVVLGFDDISSLWASFWGLHRNVLVLPASSAEAASYWLEQASRATRQANARIVFIGILDQDAAKWNAFLGGKVGIPYALLDEYRKRATIVKTYAYGNGTLTVCSVR